MATQNYFKAKNGLEIPSLDTVATTSNSFPTIRPTLNLDFANSKVVDERITFTRSTQASYYDAKGVLQYAKADEPRIDHDPVTGECKGLLIEEQRTNVTQYSSPIAIYSSPNQCSVLQNAAIAPDGTMTAARLIEGSVGSVEHYVLPNNATLSTGYITGSVYVKANGRTKGQLRLWGGGAYTIYNYDLNAVTITFAGNNLASNNSASITPVGNGWFRLSVTANFTTSPVNTLWLSTNNGTDTYYVGDGSSGIYFWGWQMEQATFPTSYIPSTTTFTSRASSATYFDSTGTLRIAGANQPRYGYGYDSTSGKWVSQGLTLEGAATNIAIYSEQFDNANWGKGNLSISPNATIAPDGSLSADKWMEDSNNSSHQVSGPSGFANSTTYTLSVFAKAAERNFLILNIWSGVSSFWTYYNLSTGVVGTNPTGNARMDYVGNGWYRCSLTVTTAATGSPNTAMWTAANDNVIMYQGVSGSGIYAWGAQLEVGSVATSYIPTSSASATRAADVSSSVATTRVADDASIYGSNLSSWYKQDEGTTMITCSSYATTYSAWRSLYEFSQFTNKSGMRQSVGLTSGGVNSAYIILPAGSAVYGITSGGGAYSGSSSASTAFAYKSNDFAVSGAGATPGTDTSGAVTSNVDYLMLGNDNEGRRLHGHIQRLAYYPKRLSNTELQALTK